MAKKSCRVVWTYDYDRKKSAPAKLLKHWARGDDVSMTARTAMRFLKHAFTDVRRNGSRIEATGDDGAVWDFHVNKGRVALHNLDIACL